MLRLGEDAVPLVVGQQRVLRTVVTNMVGARIATRAMQVAAVRDARNQKGRNVFAFGRKRLARVCRAFRRERIINRNAVSLGFFKLAASASFTMVSTPSVRY